MHNYVIVSLFADLGCLVLLSQLMRAEGGKLTDLLGFQRERLGRDILLGLCMFLVMALAYYLAPLLSALLITGTADASAAWVQGSFSTPSWVHTLALVGVVLELLYLRLRRLIPLTVGYYFIDLIFPFIFA